LIGETEPDITPIDTIIGEHRKKAEKSIYNKIDKIRARIDKILSEENKMDISPVDTITGDHIKKAEKPVHHETDKIRSRIDKL